MFQQLSRAVYCLNYLHKLGINRHHRYPWKRLFPSAKITLQMTHSNWWNLVTHTALLPDCPRSPLFFRWCKHFNILHSSNRCKDVIKQPPFVAFRRSPNLRDLLVKAQLPVISNNYFPPGSFRCGHTSPTASQVVLYCIVFLLHPIDNTLVQCTMLISTRPHKLYLLRYRWNTLHHFTLYLCNRWNLQYIGETKRRLKNRFNEHVQTYSRQN